MFYKNFLIPSRRDTELITHHLSLITSFIVELHFDGLLLFFHGYVRDLDAAEDIVIDVFTQLVAHKNRFRFGHSLKTYLYIMARSRALSYPDRNYETGDYGMPVTVINEFDDWNNRQTGTMQGILGQEANGDRIYAAQLFYDYTNGRHSATQRKSTVNGASESWQKYTYEKNDWGQKTSVTVSRGQDKDIYRLYHLSRICIRCQQRASGKRVLRSCKCVRN